ncbi:MAG: GNAT family N-acetyltransferase, partial [Ramlibacter sp.]
MLTTGSHLSGTARPEATSVPVEAEPVASSQALAQLVPEWWDLWSRSAASPFQSPAWLLPWWTRVGQGELASVALRRVDTGALVGLAPLYIHPDPGTGRRHLFPLGIATTDRLDLVVDPAWAAAARRALAAHIDRDPAWDVFEAPQLASGAALLDLPDVRGWRRTLVASDPNPILPLPAAVPAAMAQNLAYCRRRAAKAGEVVYEQADARTLPQWIDALDRLHAQRWARRDLPGVLREAGVLDWHREAAPQLLAAGLLRPLGLRIAGDVVAVLYVLADAPTAAQRRWSYYIGGFDPAASALSPGTLLVGHAIEQAQ